MKEIDFISSLHKSTKRDYLARVNDKEFQKIKLQLLQKSGTLIIGMEIGELIMVVIDILKSLESGYK